MKKAASPSPIVETPPEGEIDPQLLEEIGAIIDRIRERNRDEDPDEVYRVVTEIVEEVRQERYEAAQRAKAQGGR